MQEKPVLSNGAPQETRKPVPDKEAAQRELDCGLVDAVMEGSLEKTKSLFSMGASIDAKDYWGKTALMCACLYGHEKVAAFLVENGASINAKDKGGWTPMMFAARNGFTNVVGLLSDRGADVGSRDEREYTALMHAIEEERIDTARLMIRKGADPKTQIRNIGSLLPNAAKMGMYKIVKFVVEEGTDIDSLDTDTVDGKGITALAYAIHKNDFGMAKFLLKHGANIDKADQYDRTPLMRAVEQGDAKAVSFILENGADPDLESNIGKTALMMAARDGNLEMAKLLVEKGASIEIECKSALIEALDNRHDDIAKFLIMNGANVNAKDGYDVTALMHALANGNMAEDKFEILMLLVDKGADIGAKNSRGMDIIDLAMNYASSIPLPSSAHSAGATMWLNGIKQNAIRLQKFLEMAGAFQPLIGKGPLSELVLNFADCTMQRK
jgi:ankyrin repeat protein